MHKDNEQKALGLDLVRPVMHSDDLAACVCPQVRKVKKPPWNVVLGLWSFFTLIVTSLQLFETSQSPVPKLQEGGLSKALGEVIE